MPDTTNHSSKNPRTASAPVRRVFTVTGQVQGVGFRPFVFRIAHEHALSGQVANTPDGVRVAVQGPEEAVAAFGRDLVERIPPLARILTCDQADEEPVADETGFTILASTQGEGHRVLISPDTAICPDCLAEMLDPDNRRFLYPFTNCTNCGPRYTITRAIPYDRPATSMACFPLCEDCAHEYHNPADRRFHAQPNACPVCGPRVWLNTDCPDIEGPPDMEIQGPEALAACARALAKGRIAAIKGLGGFHLACDATNPDAVATLRRRKNRPDKPLAVMVPDLASAALVAHVGEAEKALLSGIERPIVLCPARTAGHDAASCNALAANVAPDTRFIGLMLPYTPLHFALFQHFSALAGDRVAALVMTSGNKSAEPISLGNREALLRLSAIADLFLFHDRDILIRTDDSVVRPHPTNGMPQFLRRARGYVPSPVELPDFGAPEPATVLGVGPELKNTLCLTKEGRAFPSQHIGDMENVETYQFHQEIAAHLESILQVTPELVVRDLHPDYMSTTHAEERGQTGVEVAAVQHHVAHIHAVLAENHHTGPALGLALDGTGLGEDGTLWGGELLLVDPTALTHERLAHLHPLPLPGGEAAIRNPWRIARAALWQLGIEPDPERPWPWMAEFEKENDLLPQLLERDVNCPTSTSCGRLFDAVSAMVGACASISYEGQAAIVLEHIQEQSAGADAPDDAYEVALREPDDGDGPAVWDTLALFGRVYADWRDGVAPGRISRRFHQGLANGLAEAAARFAESTGISHVGLSGGVMQNLTLSVLLPRALEARGLTPLTHILLPPNDGCISLGQAAWGRRLLQGRAHAASGTEIGS